MHNTLNMSMTMALAGDGESLGPSPPANAVTLDDGTPVVEDSGAYVTLG